MRRRERAADGAGAQAPDLPDVQPVQRMAFVQALMANSYMAENDAKQLLRRITNSGDDLAYPQVLAKLNSDLGFASFQIKTVKYQVDQQKYVGFVNTHVDEPSKSATKYSHQQRDFFKQTMDRIATAKADPDMHQGIPSCSEMELLHLEINSMQATQPDGTPAPASAAAQKKMSKQEKQSTLARLVSDGWLAGAPGRNGYYCLGVRTFLELGDYLLSLDLPNDTRETWQNLL